MKWLAAAAIGFVLALFPASALADNGDGPDDLLVRVGADVRVAKGEKVGAVIVIDGDAYIEGEVEDTVLVISGNAIISGKVGGVLTVISGDIDLQSSAQVDDVASIRGDLVRAQGATISGDIEERDNFDIPAGVLAAFSILFWLAMSVAVVVAGLVFAAIGGRQLRQTADAMTSDAVSVIIGFVFVWVVLPIVAVLAIVTLVGIPLGFGLMLFVMPALWFLGYIVAGARLGGLLTGLAGRTSGDHPYAATTLGLVLLQLGVLIPVIGVIVAGLAGLWGAGAIAVIAYRAAGGKGPSPAPSLPEPQPAA